MVKHRSKGFLITMPELYKERMLKKECPSCGLPRNEWKRRKDWRCCSVKCTNEFNKTVFKYVWVNVRILAFERDSYTCVKCNIKHPDSELIADHIIPISLGGEEYNLDNIQTLCIECHKLKTASDIKKIAELRAIEKKQKGNTQLNQEVKP